MGFKKLKNCGFCYLFEGPGSVSKHIGGQGTSNNKTELKFYNYKK